MKFEYFINLDERGEFFADVRDARGTTVFEIHGFEIFDDGFMDHKYDIPGLAYHLRTLGILKASDTITKGQ